jgi:hypothetical protein
MGTTQPKVANRYLNQPKPKAVYMPQIGMTPSDPDNDDGTDTSLGGMHSPISCVRWYLKADG